MSVYPVKDETIGPFRGRVAAHWQSPDLLSALVRVPALINSDAAVELSSGRTRNVKVALVCGRTTATVVVKVFSKPSFFKNAYDRSGRGSKARRSWLAAAHLAGSGVGTPEPVAFLERWLEGRLVESYYIAVYQEGISSFAAELSQLLRREPECRKLIELMQTVAVGVRAMHDSGFQHNDLGNQNILVRPNGDGAWRDIQFVDLNRSRLRPALTPKQRARDISRIYLPSDFLRVFKEMYWGGVPPTDFQAWERRYRARYAWHSRTRRFRHPLRERRKKAAPTPPTAYPAETDIWIWDERSGQAQTVLLSRDKNAYRPVWAHWRMLVSTLRAMIPVWVEYRRLRRSVFLSAVEMRNRIGLCIEPYGERIDRQLELLSALGKIPVLVRFYHHRGDAGMAEGVSAVKRLQRAGHTVSIALVQDRYAVTNPASWRAFAAGVLEQVAELVDRVEVGHAINRVKWGIWGNNEYRRLVSGVSALRDTYPDLHLTGPAVIDFEYPHAIAALDSMPVDFKFSALSHHLYVDRRGAPENRQGRFSTLEKCVMGRAIARQSDHCDDAFVISETNWPIEGTGVHSPVGSPYVSPGLRVDDPSVSEEQYADYMVRYFLIAICSGLVDRVYWWRLVARGYGLVDDSDKSHWRERPAFKALKTLLDRVGDGIFEERLELDSRGAVAFRFRRQDGAMLWVAYAPSGEREAELPPGSGQRVTLTGRPMFVDGDEDRRECKHQGET